MWPIAASIVRALLDGADARRWWSLHRHLELFAEAAPEAFLDAVDASLAQNDPPILALFTDDKTPVTGGIYYAELLWGFERLGWSPNYLSRVALLLARLALATRIESRNGNRPSNSLRNLFLLWQPQTYATAAERLGVLDRVLRKREPGVAWALMWQLVPNSHDTMSPSSRPRWRDFSEGRNEERVAGPVWAQSADEIAKRLLEDVNADESRWVSLLGRYADLFPQRRREAVGLLSASLERLDQETRGELWSAIRKLLNRHRRSAGADWALPESDLSPFDPIYEKLTPADPIDRIAWLFAHGEPPLPHPPVGDWQAHEDMVAAERRRAVESLASSAVPGAVIALARRAESPAEVGAAAASATMAENLRMALLEECLRDEGRLRDAARGVVYGCICARGEDWAHGLLDRAAPEGWTAEMVLTVLLMMGGDLRRTWDRLAAFGPDVEAEYWRRLPGPSVMRARGAELFGIGKLLAAGLWPFVTRLAKVGNPPTAAGSRTTKERPQSTPKRSLLPTADSGR